jgi:hypothetical protein
MTAMATGELQVVLIQAAFSRQLRAHVNWEDLATSAISVPYLDSGRLSARRSRLTPVVACEAEDQKRF